MIDNIINCPECEIEMVHVDTTYSNVKTSRCEKGQHTGDIYQCKSCCEFYIDNMLNNKLEPWEY